MKCADYLIGVFNSIWIESLSILESLKSELEPDNEDYYNLNIRFNKCRNVICNSIPGLLKTEISYIDSLENIKKYDLAVEILGKISNSEKQALNLALTNKKQQLRIKTFYQDANTIYDKFVELLKSNDENENTKLIMLENMLVRENESLGHILQVVQNEVEQEKIENPEILRMYVDIRKWFNDCEKKITPLRNAYDAIPTILQSEEYDKFFQLIREVGQHPNARVNSFISEDLKDHTIGELGIKDATEIINKRWSKYSCEKYIEYRNKAETNLVSNSIDPRVIEKEFNNNISKGLMPLEDLSWDEDERNLFHQVRERLNNAAVMTRNLEEKFRKTLIEDNPISGIRRLNDFWDLLREKPYLKNVYHDIRMELVEKCHSFLENVISELTIIFENVPNSSVMIESRVNLLITEIQGLSDFDQYRDFLVKLSRMNVIIKTTVSNLNPSPKMALEQIDKIIKEIKAEGFGIPAEIRDLRESILSTLSPLETINKILIEIKAPSSFEEITNLDQEKLKDDILYMQNAMKGITAVKTEWTSGSNEREKRIQELNTLLIHSMANRDFLLAKKEMEKEKPNVQWVKKLLESADKSNILSNVVADLRQKMNSVATADNQVGNLIVKANKLLAISNIPLSSLFQLVEEIEIIEDQPSYKIHELMSVKDKVVVLMKKKLNQFFISFLENPEKFIYQVDDIKTYLAWIKNNQILMKSNDGGLSLIDLEGAYYECCAWKAIDRNSSEKSDWETPYSNWYEAEVRNRLNARFHRLASLKALAIASFKSGNYASLLKTRNDSLLKNDGELTILYAFFLLQQCEEEYKNPATLLEQSGNNKFNNIKNIFNVIPSRKIELENTDSRENINEHDALVLNQIWSQYYAKRVPKNINENELKKIVNRRQILYGDLLSVANRMRMDSNICDFYNANELAKKIIQRLEKRDQRNPINK